MKKWDLTIVVQQRGMGNVIISGVKGADKKQIAVFVFVFFFQISNYKYRYRSKIDFTIHIQ